MYSTEIMRAVLVDGGMLGQADFDRACDYAKRHSIDIDEAMVSLELLDFTALGAALSAIYKLPYRNLHDFEPGPKLWAAFSPKCAHHWGVVPVEYDPETLSLTIAVPETGIAEKLETIFELIEYNGSLLFTIASGTEIQSVLSKLKALSGFDVEKKIIREPTSRPMPGKDGRPVPYGPRPIRRYEDDDSGDDQRERPSIGIKAPAEKKSKEPEPPPGYATPSKDLRDTMKKVALMVSEELKDKPTKLKQIREKVRYCQLLSARLAMEPKRSQRTVLAAWLAALGKSSELPAKLGNPGNVMSVLKQPAAHRMPLIEQRVISVVGRYLSLVAESPDVVRNQNILQKDLRPSAMAGDEGQLVLGTFLELLRDERFLSESSSVRASVIIVDGVEFSAPRWGPVLARNGFQVESVATLSDARRYMKRSSYNVLIVAAQHSDGEGVSFCREVRRAAGGPALVGIVPLSPPPTADDYLAAGADQAWPEDIPVADISDRCAQLAGSRQQTAVAEGLQGNLSQLNLVDMIQILSAAGQDMRISLRKNGRAGHVYMQQGELVSAELEDTTGEDALFELLSWFDGDFAASVCADFPPKNLSGDTLGLLMEAARVADEARAKAEGLPTEE